MIVANAIALAVYMPLAALAGFWIANRLAQPVRAWLEEGRAPTEEERRTTLCLPLQSAGIDALGWAGGAIVFFFVNVGHSAEAAWHVSSVIVLGGLTCTALGYLLTERLARPLTARTLSYGPVTRPKGPGVAGRLTLVWLFASGMPIVGVILVACQTLTEGGVTAEELATATLVLGGAAFLIGLFGTLLVAKSVSEPLRAMRKALRKLEGGDLEANVAVNDGSEVGLLQSGFNSMAAGLRERERMRDLFGRHVGEDVVRSALDGGEPELGGEVRPPAERPRRRRGHRHLRGPRRRRQRRRGAPLRVHGHRRPGERGRPPVRAGQAPARARARLRGDPAPLPQRRGGALARRRGDRPARSHRADTDRHAGLTGTYDDRRP
jgi:adenylate cyclase